MEIGANKVALASSACETKFLQRDAYIHFVIKTFNLLGQVSNTKLALRRNKVKRRKNNIATK